MTRQAIFRALCHFVVVLQLAIFGGSAAQAENNIVPTLVAESSHPAPGTTVMLALDMKPKPGWHGYWKNPGDAGVAADLKWALPAGATIGAMRFPVPERLIVAGLMNHVFNGEHALLVPITIPAGLTPGTQLPIRASAQYLSCTDQVCVPEQADIALNLIAGDGAVTDADRARFDGWRAKLPRPLGSEAKFSHIGSVLRIGIPFPQTMKAETPWFFAATEHAVRYAAAQKVSRNGDVLVIEVEATENQAPARIDGILGLGGGLGLEVSASPGNVAAGAVVITIAPGLDHAPGASAFSASAPVDAGSGQAGPPTGLFVALIGALIGGLILNVMPCVFPIISLKALSLARSGSGDERAVKREALAYAAGTIVTCLGLGGLLLALRAGGTAVGWAFQLQDPRIILLLLLLTTAITMNMLGVFHLRSFGGGEKLAGKGGAVGAFWTGALAAFVATPCTGPFMAAALGAALVLPTLSALAIFAGLGTGLALPFLLIGYIPALRSRMPRPGPWMETFQRWMALPMALTALALGWLLWRQTGVTGLLYGFAATLVLVAGLITTRRSAQPNMGRLVMGGILLASISAMIALPTAGHQTAIPSRSGVERFSTERLAQLRAAGKPVFLYFTADWCVTCKVNEKAAIEREEVERAFKAAGVTPMVGDWTNGDPEITRFLEGQGRSGVPLYLIYRPNQAAPVVLPQVLTPQLLIDAIT
jgi:DsbC/DsbD-like thiol-disulfide interchange protein/cytochrome c biogenesis protein CcdA